jgi:hypothetical protein
LKKVGHIHLAINSLIRMHAPPIMQMVTHRLTVLQRRGRSCQVLCRYQPQKKQMMATVKRVPSFRLKVSPSSPRVRGSIS